MSGDLECDEVSCCCEHLGGLGERLAQSGHPVDGQHTVPNLDGSRPEQHTTCTGH